MKSDAAYFTRRPTAKGNRPDMMSHTCELAIGISAMRVSDHRLLGALDQVPFCDNTERLGYSRPEHAFCITPNVSVSQEHDEGIVLRC